MLFVLALRNVAKTWPKRLAFGVFFAATVALLFLGNTIFENSDRGLAATYAASFTGQASVSAASTETFTIFGSDLPLIGQYLSLPVLSDPDALRRSVEEAMPKAEILSQVTAAARLELENYHSNVPVFGVEFQKYFGFFPSLKVVAGAPPESTKPAVMLTKTQADQVSRKLGRPLAVGDLVTLTLAVNTSFVTRQVPLAGIYTYPAADKLLDRIVLTDPDTARALNGYLYGEAVVLDEKSRGLMSKDLEDLFSDQPDPEPKPAAPSSAPAAPAVSGEGAWNFLLVKEKGRGDASVLSDLNAALDGQPVHIRDWRQTAGGTAQIAWFLRVIFNLGLFFIAIVSCLILVNSLSLSILERTKEIGTMRALGAERGFVGGLIAWETLLVVVGMGVLGIAAGSAAVAGLSAAKLKLSNEYLASLFGSNTLSLELSWPSIVSHLFLTVVLGLVSVIFPVRKAVLIEPVKAIAREQ